MTTTAGEMPVRRPVRGLRLGGRYELRSRIAVGGMGEVWASQDLALGRSVATKVLRPELAGDDRFLARLRAEARTSAPLAHPNIAALYDYGEDDGAGYLIMELVAGEPLADVLEREHVLGPDAVLPILAQAARALHAAHVCGIVHRDIKPSNILLTPDGRVKITDFGISVAANEARTGPHGVVLGTAQYLAPEQALGRPVTPASDIYSLGVVAYEALVGRRPFTGPTLAAIASAHVTDPVPDLPDFVPAPVRDVVGRMLAKDPERRPRSAASLARALERIAKEIELARPVDAAAERTGEGGRHAHASATGEHGRHRRTGGSETGPAVRIRAERGGIIEVTLPGQPVPVEPDTATVPWVAPVDDDGAPAISGEVATGTGAGGDAARGEAVGESRAGAVVGSGGEEVSGPEVAQVGMTPEDIAGVAAPVLDGVPAQDAPDMPSGWPVASAGGQSVQRFPAGAGTSARRLRALHRRSRWSPGWISLLWLLAVAALAIAAVALLAAGTLGRAVESAPTSTTPDGWHVAAGALAGEVGRAAGLVPGHRTQSEDGSW